MKRTSSGAHRPSAVVPVRVPPSVADVMRCPECGLSLVRSDGPVTCGQGHKLRELEGYIDARVNVPDEDTRRTFESFGYEWTRFSRIEREDRQFWERYFQDVPRERLDGAVVLDAGCGKGRFAYFTAPEAKALVALDGSAAVEAAAHNLEGFDNTVVVRADLRDAPFAEGAFDFVYCLGVLHHLTDPESGFAALDRLLAPGGTSLTYVYSRPDRTGVRALGLRGASLLRRWTVRLPHPILRAVSVLIAALLYASVVLPGQFGERHDVGSIASLPLQTYRRRPWRALWLDTFDRLSAPIEHRYVWSDIAPWYERRGYEVEAVREDAGLFVLARKPE